MTKLPAENTEWGRNRKIGGYGWCWPAAVVAVNVRAVVVWTMTQRQRKRFMATCLIITKAVNVADKDT